MSTGEAKVTAGLPVGETCRSTGRTISEGELMLLHHMVGATAPLHTNRHYMSDTPYGERILAGGVLVAIIAAGWSTSDLNQRLIRDCRLRWKAALGLEGRFRNAVLPGDTIYGVYTIQSARSSRSMPGYGVMTVGLRGENQRGETVMEGALNAMFDRV